MTSRTAMSAAALCALLALGRANAQTWQPTPGQAQIPIWPGQPPDARPDDKPETLTTEEKPVAGRPWSYVSHVSTPTMTVYPAKGKNTGAAVVVFPGGGYEILAIDLEGTEACAWLTAKGMTCILLKYRVPCEKTGPYRDCRTALEDAQRTVGLVRSRAAEWGVDPRKIGVMGFSAGGHMVAAMSTHFDKRLYTPIDAADQVSCRPDFAVALYPGHLWGGGEAPRLNPDIRVSQDTPPTFLLQAKDDPVDNVKNSLAYNAALKKANIPVELHVYPRGGHAFGLRRTQQPISDWPPLVETWLRTIGIIRK